MYLFQNLMLFSAQRAPTDGLDFVVPRHRFQRVVPNVVTQSRMTCHLSRGSQPAFADLALVNELVNELGMSC